MSGCEAFENQMPWSHDPSWRYLPAVRYSTIHLHVCALYEWSVCAGWALVSQSFSLIHTTQEVSTSPCAGQCYSIFSVSVLPPTSPPPQLWLLFIARMVSTELAIWCAGTWSLQKPAVHTIVEIMWWVADDEWIHIDKCQIWLATHWQVSHWALWVWCRESHTRWM